MGAAIEALDLRKTQTFDGIVGDDAMGRELDVALRAALDIVLRARNPNAGAGQS